MDNLHNAHIAIIGGGPAGLMAAEVLASAGCEVHVFDAMPSVGRKFLLAGRGGLNLTHSEASEVFITRYRMPRAHIERWLAEFDAPALSAWARGLGIETFVGSSGRIFPLGMKTSPLLRAWLVRLAKLQVHMHLRHRWQGWSDTGQLEFTTPAGNASFAPSATILALGGGSWARLGSDGAWMPLLVAQGVATSPLRPANCGFEIVWSEHLRTRFAGAPVKSVVATLNCVDGSTIERPGEFVISRHGVEGSLIYALSASLRELIEVSGEATLNIDLAPAHSLTDLTTGLSRPRGSDSLANHLRRRAGITGVKAALLREHSDKETLAHPQWLAARIKRLPLRLTATRPIDEAISSAGGVHFNAVDDHLMLRAKSGVFIAGEMLDWDAPTGGYLLTGCFASGCIAARGVLNYLAAVVEP